MIRDKTDLSPPGRHYRPGAVLIRFLVTPAMQMAMEHYPKEVPYSNNRGNPKQVWDGIRNSILL